MQMSADGKKLFHSGLIVLSVFLATTALTASVHPAFALSELKDEQGQVQQKPAEGKEAPPAEEEQKDDTGPIQLPMPDPLIRRNEAVTEPTDDAPATDDTAVEEPQAPVEVIYDIAKAPEAVRRMRELIVEAAASGDIERLRPLLGKGVTETQVSLVETEEGPLLLVDIAAVIAGPGAEARAALELRYPYRLRHTSTRDGKNYENLPHRRRQQGHPQGRPAYP